MKLTLVAARPKAPTDTPTCRGCRQFKTLVDRTLEREATKQKQLGFVPVSALGLQSIHKAPVSTT